MKTCNSTDCEVCSLSNPRNFKLLNVAIGRKEIEKKRDNYLVFVITGKLKVITSTGDEVSCMQDELFLLESGQFFHIEVEEQAQLILFTFNSTTQICEKLKYSNTNEIVDSANSKLHPLPIKRPLKILLETILFYFNDHITCYYWQKAKQMELIVILLNYYTTDEIGCLLHPLIQKNIGFYSKVIANSTKAKTVTELARLCGYSLTTFYKLFNEQFENTSPYKWMLQQNSPLIKQKILDKNVPIKTIVAEFGFIDQSHLNRYCKRYLGATPLQIRKNNL